MCRDSHLYLDDILEAISRILEYTAGQEYESFQYDLKTQDAVVRNLEIIGEAAGKLPKSCRDAAPEIEWRKIVGLRNLLAHEYFGVSLPIIWNVVQHKLVPLQSACRSLMQDDLFLREDK